VVNVRVVIVGASGNLGTSMVKALAADNSTESILGVARRRPGSMGLMRVTRNRVEFEDVCLS
jgi:uncharacterized protein YbjT (DUF2867 family)